MKFYKNKYLLIIGLLSLASTSFGQDSNSQMLSSSTATDLVLALVLIAALVVLGVALSLYRILKIVVRDLEVQKAEAKGEEFVPEKSLWEKLMASWTKSVPVKDEDKIDTGHEYDGIRELDNHLPPWWLALFYGSIVFGAIYLFGYHVADIWPLQEEEYEIAVAQAAEIQAARMAEDPFDPSKIEYNDDPVFLAAGKATYEATCASCHRADGGGGAGPNLADKYWIHGGDILSIYNTIKNGVVAKGMASWEKALGPKKMAQVASYVYSMEGTNPPDAKGPQGELFEREGGTSEGDTNEEEESTEGNGNIDSNDQGGE